MRGLYAVLWCDLMLLRRRLWRTLASYSISPTLFLIAFGWGMGRQVSVNGTDYLSFMLPGLLALSSMSQSFSLGTDLNVARFYTMTFEELQTAPVSGLVITLGKVLGGMLRGLAAATVVGLIALAAGRGLQITPLLVISILMNAFVFASAAVLLAMVVRSHADQASLNSFVIVPMSFLCGTFFPLERLPHWAQALVNLLPLTHASRCIRAAALGREFPLASLLILAAIGVLLLLGAARAVRRASI